MSKKTLKLIDESDNKYVVGVKRNQPKLYDNLVECCKNKVIDEYIEKGRSKGRDETRITKVFKNELNKDNQKKWESVKSLIQVTRIVKEKNNRKKETAYYISNIVPYKRAKMLGKGIRKHWNIESFHYVKDVVFKEDYWKTRKGSAPQNYSLIRNIVLNIFRNNNLNQIQSTIEKCSNNVKYMMSLI